jgi:predicted metal-dependent HD superfamily phosphohydrolase
MMIDYSFSKAYNTFPAVYDTIRSDFIYNLSHLLKSSFKLEDSAARMIARCLYGKMDNDVLFYHKHTHILSMLQFAQEHRIELNPIEHLAVWFHDCVYFPKAQNGYNETESANFAQTLLAPYISFAYVHMVCGYIRDTAQYSNYQWLDSLKILDLDLCTFAFDYDNFKYVQELIAKEFAPYYDEHEIKSGTQSLFRAFLSRPSIYRTKFFQSSFEEKATTNLLDWISDDG